MRYIEVCIEIKPFTQEFAEIAMAILDELPFESYNIEEPYLLCYIREDDFSDELLRANISNFNIPSVNISTTTRLIESCNWNALWESNFDPVFIDNRCVVKASFHKGIKPRKYNILIDPKMAFGTGHHQTTRLMMEALLEESIDGKKVLDMGCGTAVLAILAAKMGAALPVYAVDIDEVAVESSKENAKKNRLQGKIEAFTGDASFIEKESYDIILANINKNIILKDLDIYALGLKPAGLLILSGFYNGDVDEIQRESVTCGLSGYYHNSLNDWAVLKYIKG